MTYIWQYLDVVRNVLKLYKTDIKPGSLSIGRESNQNITHISHIISKTMHQHTTENLKQPLQIILE